MTVSPRYQAAGLILARVTTDPGDLDLPTHLNLADPTAVQQEGRAWLAKVWVRPEVRDALTMASPVLAARLDRIANDTRGNTLKETRRAVVSVASYLMRWQRRATPFGLFAGIGTVDIGPAAAKVGSDHRAMMRADSEWVTTLVDRLEQHHHLRHHLTVTVDDARVVRDGRVIVHRRAEVGAATPGPLRESSVRLTRPVRFVLTAASSPIRFDALANEMIAAFPSASPHVVHQLLHGLVDARVLITSLRPPMTSVDPLTHLIDALRNADADTLDDLDDLGDGAALLRDLDAISVDLAQHNHTKNPCQSREIRAATSGRMSAMIPGSGPTLAADVRIDASITLPKRVLDEAARAATVLLRTATQPFGTAAWLDYHARFRERYGPGALVPVRDLVAESGLGYPTGYLGAPRARPAWRVLTARDAALLAWIQRAILSGAQEIELTDADVDELTVGEPADAVLPQRIELGVELHAASTAAITHGEFGLRVTAAPHAHTSMAGRFAYLLDDDDRAWLAATYSAPSELSEKDGPGSMAVQLSFPPRRPHNENVVRVASLLDNILSLSEHPDLNDPSLAVLRVSELAVTADADQMYLVHLSTGQRVIPQIPHALDTSVQSPPLARFLAEVADARTAVFRGFDLGAARVLPYVPRIRYRRTVLSPARWVLSGADLNESTADGEKALLSWRQQWRVPERVVLVHGELRLPLRLDHELDRSLLFARLERGDRIELHEDGPPDGHSWIGRPAELLIPMTTITPSARPLPATAAPGAALQPGDSAMIHAQLAGNPARFDEILTAHLPLIAAELDNRQAPDRMVESWWVRRHRDLIRPEADQHLAVFLRLTRPEHYGPVAARLAAFAADLDSRGLPGQLTLAPAPQHLARYGDGPALAAAEQVFATDTAAAIAQLVTAQASGTPAQALAAASMAHLAASFAPNPYAGYRALLGCLPREQGPLDRTLREHALTVADAAQQYQAIRALPGGDALVAALDARDMALSTYHNVLVQQGRQPRAVLRTLLHEHHIRAVGVDPTVEKETGRLARAIAMRQLATAGSR